MVIAAEAAAAIQGLYGRLSPIRRDHRWSGRHQRSGEQKALH